MPRIENIGNNIVEWADRTGEPSSTFDVCQKHYIMIMRDPHRYNNALTPYGHNEPSGDRGRGGDVDHPPYDEDVSSCAVCGCTLTGRDDYPD